MISATGQADDGLIVQFELVEGQRVLQIRAKLQPLDDAFVHRRLEDTVTALAVALGHVHRDVCVPEQIGGGGCLELLTDEADADTRAREDVLAFDLDR